MPAFFYLLLAETIVAGFLLIGLIARIFITSKLIWSQDAR